VAVIPWLSIALGLPLVGSVVVALLPKPAEGAPDRALPQKVAFGFSLVTLAVVALVGVGFDTSGPRFQFVENHTWIQACASAARMTRRPGSLLRSPCE